MQTGSSMMSTETPRTIRFLDDLDARRIVLERMEKRRRRFRIVKVPNNTTLNNLGFTATPTTAGTAADGDQTQAPFLRQATSGALNDVARITSGDNVQTSTQWDPFFEWYGRTFTSIADMRLWRGMQASDITASSDPTTIRTIAFRYDTGAGDSTWKAYVSNGTSSTIKDTGISLATGTIYRLAIEVYESGTKVDYWIDGKIVARMRSGDNIPGAGYLGWGVSVTALAATAKRQMTSYVELAY